MHLEPGPFQNVIKMYDLLITFWQFLGKCLNITYLAMLTEPGKKNSQAPVSECRQDN